MSDGSIFLEGKGVQPTLRVPVDETTIYREDDFVLEYGIRAVLQPLGAGITPAKQPTFLSPDETQSALSSAKQFEEKAREDYAAADLNKVPNTLPYTVVLSKSETLLWAWGWCAKDTATLKDNMSKFGLQFTLNGEEVALDKFLNLEYESGGQQCVVYILGLKDWAGGEHRATTVVTFKSKMNDGTADYPAGTQTFEYSIYVKP
jgi:hypothetical protein